VVAPDHLFTVQQELLLLPAILLSKVQAQPEVLERKVERQAPVLTEAQAAQDTLPVQALTQEAAVPHQQQQAAVPPERDIHQVPAPQIMQAQQIPVRAILLPVPPAEQVLQEQWDQAQAPAELQGQRDLLQALRNVQQVAVPREQVIPQGLAPLTMQAQPIQARAILLRVPPAEQVLLERWDPEQVPAELQEQQGLQQVRPNVQQVAVPREQVIPQGLAPLTMQVQPTQARAILLPVLQAEQVLQEQWDQAQAPAELQEQQDHQQALRNVQPVAVPREQVIPQGLAPLTMQAQPTQARVILLPALPAEQVLQEQWDQAQAQAPAEHQGQRDMVPVQQELHQVTVQLQDNKV
jgi:hypothetical protein